MGKYWATTVQFEIEDNNGKIKKVKETYLVDAVSATESEAMVHKALEKDGESNFQVVGTTQSKILRVIE